MKIKIEKLKELLHPSLSLHEYPNLPIYNPLLPSWTENDSNQSPTFNSSLNFLFRKIMGLILFIAKLRFDVLHTISIIFSRTHKPSELLLTKHCANYLIVSRDIPSVFCPASDKSSVGVNIDMNRNW